MFKAVVLAFNSVRLVPHVLVLLGSSRRDVFWADMARWAEVYQLGPSDSVSKRIRLFVHLMAFYQEFRNLYYLRVGWPGRLFALLCRPVATLRIEADRIGPGLFIQHGFGTWITAEEIGDNCWINQQVTIGWANGLSGRPSIGNNVTIAVGAKILGSLRLGDGSKVGANSVVIMDVPPGVTVMGVPATALWGSKVSSRRG